jgi:hypothetical protein
MKNNLVKIYSLPLILLALVVFTQAYGEGQTNFAVSPTTIISTSAWFVAGTGMQRGVNVVEGNAGTNGLKCVLEIANDKKMLGLEPPVCRVCVIITNTNSFSSGWCWKSYDTNYLEIELLDSEGKPVERTTVGESYRYSPVNQQIEDSFEKFYRESSRRTVQGFIFMRFYPALPLSQFTIFSIPALFKLKQPGEYTLRVKMRLLERTPGNRMEKEFTFLPLPEVTTKILIRASDAPNKMIQKNGF